MGGTLGAAGASIASAGSAVSQITGRNNNSFKSVLDNLEVNIYGFLHLEELNSLTKKRAGICQKGCLNANSRKIVCRNECRAENKRSA